MANILIRGPLLTQSGYGVHSRQIFRWAHSRGHNISVNLTPWGITPWYVNKFSLSGMIGEIMKATNPASTPPDISFQVQLPNEWDPNLCRHNIGVTAGVETNICNPSLLLFDNSKSPSDPAKAFDVMKMNKKIIFKNLIICYELYSVYGSKVNQDLVLKMT